MSTTPLPELDLHLHRAPQPGVLYGVPDLGDGLAVCAFDRPERSGHQRGLLVLKTQHNVTEFNLDWHNPPDQSPGLLMVIRQQHLEWHNLAGENRSLLVVIDGQHLPLTHAVVRNTVLALHQAAALTPRHIRAPSPCAVQINLNALTVQLREQPTWP